MAGFNTFTFDGENSLDYGVYITGEAVYNAPERAVEMVSIPGKNGALALDQGRFENIEVTYPAGTFGVKQTEFAGRMRALRNMLASRYNYVRLTDSYHPDEYRLGLYKSGLEVTPVAMSSAGDFELTFNCKPQRFLTSGEDPEDFVPGQSPADEQTKTGAIVTFEAEENTIISDLVADIEPVQDLHGYDKPWVGGAGKNKYTSKYSGRTNNGITFSLNSDGDIVLNNKATDSSYYASSATYSTDDYATYLKAGTYTLRRTEIANVRFNARTTTGTSFGSSYQNEDLTFTLTEDAYVFVNVRVDTSDVTYSNQVLHIQIEQGETATAYEPYTNICPISGWDEAEVSRTGINVWDEEWESGSISTSDGSNQTSTARIRSKNYISVKPNTQYYLKNGGSGTVYVFRYDENKQYLGYHAESGAFTIPSDTYFIRFTPNSTYGATYGNNISINYPSTDIDYHAYNGNTYAIDLDGTRYGGTLDVTSGVLTVTHGGTEMGDLTYTYDSTNMRFSASISGMKVAEVRTLELLSSAYECIVNQPFNVNLNGVIYNGNNAALFVHDHNYNNASAFKTARTGEKIIYPLATPLTVQLTPTEVKTLLGTNNVGADSGNVTVKYGTNPYLITNPTPFDAQPLLKVTGAGVLGIGDYTITITGTAGQVIYIDCETMEIYKNTGGIITPAGSLVNFATNEFPKLPSGVSGVSLGDGITEVEITPRWWII